MNSLGNGDIAMIVLGVAVAVWCIGLSVYTVVADVRRRKASLNALTAAFSERLRKLAHSS